MTSKTKLVLERASQTLSEGGFGEAVMRLAEQGQLDSHLRDAKLWVDEAIAAVRSAPDNTLETEEQICQAILDRLDSTRQ